MTAPRRQITTIRNKDWARIARLEIEAEVLYASYLQAFERYLDKRDQLREARGELANAEELLSEISEFERRAS